MPFNYEKQWKTPIIKAGVITLILAAFASFLPVLYLTFGLGINPAITDILKAWGFVVTIFGAFYIVEPVTYYSALGLSGTYLSFLSGNIANMRVPCSIIGLEATNTQPGTPRAEIISVLAISGSIIMNLLILTVMAFLGATIIAILPDVIIEGFRAYTVPAVYGSIFAQVTISQPKLAPYAIVIPTTLFYFNLPAYFSILISVAALVGIAKLFYSKQRKKLSF